MPILGVGAVAATVAPMVAMTGCNKEEAAMKVVEVDSDDNTNFNFILKYTKYIKGHNYSAPEESLEYDHHDEIKSLHINGFADEDVSNGELQFKNAIPSGQIIKVTVTFQLMDKETEKFTIILNCVGK